MQIVETLFICELHHALHQHQVPYACCPDDRYNAVRDKKTGVVFYVDTSTEMCYLTTPREATLARAHEHSVDTGRCLGQHREWEASIPLRAL